MQQGRRQFLKISSLGATGAALTFPAIAKGYSFLGPEDAFKGNTGVRKVPTVCEVCFWSCAGWTHLDENDKIVSLSGNVNDPHSQGRLCTRGTGGIGMYEDEDRLKHPLIRKEKDGKQYYEEATWDEALDLIADKMKGIAKEHGPEAMALISHGSGGKFLAPLLYGYGSRNNVHPSYSQCRGPREAGFESVFGTGVYSPEPTDIKNTRCLVLLGAHIGENVHNGQVNEMAQAIDNKATIITVDPRFSVAASKSKYWLPIKPATDMALLLSWMHVLIYDDLYNKKYIEKYAEGFEELKKHVAPYTPEWAYGETGLKPEMIRKTAIEMAAAAPATIVHPGRHVTWYGDDSQRARAVAIVNALLGSWGKKGGFYFYTKASVPSYPKPAFPKAKWKWPDAIEGKYPLANEGVVNAVVDITHPSHKNEMKVKGWIVNGSNLITTLPNTPRTIEAINELDLLVVIDTMPAEITGYADVVLPECTYLERYDDLRVSRHRIPTIALRMPAAKPKYNSKPDWWIAKQLAEKLDLGKYFPWENIEEYLDYRLKKAGSSLEEMQKIGVKVLDRPKGDPLYIEDDEDYEFYTDSGKIQLYSHEFEESGFDPLPKYTKHPQPEAGFYRLNYGRAPMHSFTRTTNNKRLRELMSENALWVHPKVAKEWDLKKGQEVWLQNQDNVISSTSIKIRITERIRWDSVYMVHGFGRSDKRLTNSYGKGMSDSELITNVMTDPVMGGTGMRGNFVTFITEKPENKATV